MIATDGQQTTSKRFHNINVNVYETRLPLEEIKFWRENNRTIFTFHRLELKTGKSLDDLTLEEITKFLAAQDIHKLEELAKSIERNGVQVPLIILEDGTLLDGNRRFFACYYLKINREQRPACLDSIPVWIVAGSIDIETKLKILAEENFIKDLKLPWSLDAQARAVSEYYNELKTKGFDEEETYSQLQGVFGISKQRARDLLETLALTIEFISEGAEDDRVNRRIIVEEKFVYFWEFRNKAMKGNSKYSDASEFQEVKAIFFKLMGMGRDSPIKNVKQVEPLSQAKRDKTAWAMLNEDNGSKLSTVVAIVNDKKELRRAEDKIRAFIGWLEGVNELSEGTKTNLLTLRKLIEAKLN